MTREPFGSAKKPEGTPDPEGLSTMELTEDVALVRGAIRDLTGHLHEVHFHPTVFRVHVTSGDRDG